MRIEWYGIITLFQRDHDRPTSDSFKIFSVPLFDREQMRAAHGLPTDRAVAYQVD